MGEIATGGSYTASSGQTKPQQLKLIPRLSPRVDLQTVLDLLHVGTPDTSWLAFTRKRGDKWEEYASVRLRQLRARAGQPWLSGLETALAHDGYVTINAMFRGGAELKHSIRRRNTIIEGQHVTATPGPWAPDVKPAAYLQRVKPGTGGLQYPYREAAGAQWLPAVWVDVDGYRATHPTDVRGTMANVMRAFDEGRIPPVSFLVRSGRGVWAFWLTVDDRNPTADEPAKILNGTSHTPQTPMRASRIALRLQQAINTALAERLKHIGADPAATDAARCVRIPGSIHTGSGSHVEWWPLFLDGRMPVYRLAELHADLGLTELAHQCGRRPKMIGPTLSEAQQQQRVKACQARHRRVWDAILQLSANSGGLREGQRNNALFYLALSGHHAGITDAEIERTIHATARASQGFGGDDFSEAQVRSILKSASKKARATITGASFAKIAADIGLGEGEARAVGLYKRKRDPQRTANLVARAGAISEIIDTGGIVPSVRDMAGLLAARGVRASHQAVWNTYRLLGLKADGRAGRKKARRLF